MFKPVSQLISTEVQHWQKTLEIVIFIFTPICRCQTSMSLPNSAINNEDLSSLPNLMSSRCVEVQLPQVGNAERRNPLENLTLEKTGLNHKCLKALLGDLSFSVLSVSTSGWQENLRTIQRNNLKQIQQ